MKLLRSLFVQGAKTCDTYAGYIAFYYTVKRLVVAALALTITKFIGSSLKASTRIQTVIESVAPDTHVLHTFRGVVVTPRQETRQRHVRRNNRHVTENYTVTVYDATNFVGPNGTPMNDVRGMKVRPSGDTYVVQLRNGFVDGGVVLPPMDYWNPCVTTLKHKANVYRGVERRHNAACATLVGKPWDVYLQEDGTIQTHNALQIVKSVLACISIVLSVSLVRDVVASGLLIGNGFYENYALSKVFDTELGTAGQRYAKWWTWAFKADKREECVRLLGDVAESAQFESFATVADFAEGAALLAKVSTDSIALAYLSAITKNPKGGTVNTATLASEGLRIFLVRLVLVFLLFAVVTRVFRNYIFNTVMKVEERNDRPMVDYVLLLVVSAVTTLFLSQYVYVLHAARLRAAFKQRVGNMFDVSDFPTFDHARIAL